ncbi:MAG: LCP family protein [Bacillota bacterium]|nr:LCP family protein [Bacillota bacterium]
MRRFFKTFFISLLLILILVAGLGAFAYFNGDLLQDILPKTDLDGQELTFVVLGVDSLDAGDQKGIRSDTIMVAKADFDSGTVKILSIPRDTRTYVKGKKDKINHAHSYGGVDMALESINALLDTDIKYYARVDYRAVEEMVDAIGGVDIYVPRRMEYSDPSVDFTVDLYEGQQVLDGQKAMEFLRWRKNNDYTAQYENGDVGRIESQQYFIKEFAKQVLQGKNILKMPKLINIFIDKVDTNIPVDDMLSGLNLARKINSDKIETYTLPGKGQYINQVSYFVYDETGMANTLIEMGLK